MMDYISVNLPSVIGRGYRTFWQYKGRYLVCKGSRGSKKSTTASLKMIANIMKYPLAHGLVVRRYDITHRDSTYAQLLWAINRLQVSHLWKASLSPMQLTFLPTGQKIFFRGMDDPQSIASITTEFGSICFVWIEEAFQITNESDFDKLDLTIRGEMPEGYFKQFILTFNPWDQKIWLKSRFFDSPDPDVLAMTTNYMCNEFLGQDDIAIFERMKTVSPRRFQVEGLGGWGISEGLIYTNWIESVFDWREKLQETNSRGEYTYTAKFGLDFGFSIDPTAFIACLVSVERREIWIFDEIFKYRMSNLEIYRALKYKEYHKVKIVADSEDTRTINELWTLGLSRITGAEKGPDSVRAGIQKLQDYKIYVHPCCENTIVELSNYCWAKDRSGKQLPKPADDGYDHLLDGLRYATEDISADNFSF